jgi:xanthine/CO dehydrogenase XdhC/CoxF family maturation factor
MKELQTILDTAARLRDAGRPFALATVAKINGSAYRQPGTRMLVTADGERYGTISGGCLEDEVAQRALQVLEDGTPIVDGFDLSDDDLILGFGIGCEGVIHMMIEPVPSGEEGSLALVRSLLDRRVPGVIASVIGPPDAPESGEAPSDGSHSDALPLGASLLFDGQGVGGALADHLSDRSNGDLADRIVADARSVLDAEQTDIRSYDGVDVLLEYQEPPIHLVVCGDGHDVRPVVRIAREIGWPVTVVGKSAPEKLAQRFPEASEHVFLMNPEEIREKVSLDARTPVVIMNHNFQRDKTLVHRLLRSEVPYVGQLGPSYRTERILDELEDEHGSLPGIDRVHGPVGLDIGTETPQEIALAIAAEIQAELSGRSAQKLRERDKPIHARV